MANKTVYPFGTGGNLPSSIGIINDLETGGADKALSAQMGVQLESEIEQLRGGLSIGIDVNEDGLYFVDSSMYIGAYFDDSGFHAINIVEL